MTTFRQFLAEQEAGKADPMSKLAPIKMALTSVLNISPKDAENAISKSAPVFAQAVAKLSPDSVSQIGLAQLRVEPHGKMYKIYLVNDTGNMLYRDGRKVEKMSLLGTVDADTYERISAQGLTGWNNVPKKEK